MEGWIAEHWEAIASALVGAATVGGWIWRAGRSTGGVLSAIEGTTTAITALDEKVSTLRDDFRDDIGEVRKSVVQLGETVAEERKERRDDVTRLNDKLDAQTQKIDLSSQRIRSLSPAQGYAAVVAAKTSDG